MRSHSRERYSSPAPAGARCAVVKAIPSALYWLVAVAVGSSSYVTFEPAPTDLLFLLLFAVVLLKRGIGLAIDLHPILSIGLLGFFAGSVLSLLASDVLGSAVFHLSVTAYLLTAWFIVVTLLANYGNPMWELIRRAFLVAATIAAIIGLVSHFSSVLQDYLGVPHAYGDRARGAFKDPNVYAPFLCAALILVINHMITHRLLSVFSIFLLCLFSVQILGAFSRGAYVNLAVCLFVYLVLQLFVIYRREWLARSLILVVVGSFLVTAASITFLRVSGLEHFMSYRMQLQEYDADRFATQSLALDTIAEAPFGIGPGQSELLFNYGTHNLYLQIAVENGALSILCFLLFIATTFWISLQGTWRRGPYQNVHACSIAILAGILANSFVIDSLHWRHLFLFLAIPPGLWQHELWATRAAQPMVDLTERPERTGPSHATPAAQRRANR